MFHRAPAALLGILLLAACGGASPGASTEAGESAAASAGASEAMASEAAASEAAASTGTGGDGLASIDLTITGGDYAGTYAVEITAGGCSTGVVGPGTFTVASSGVDPAGEFDGPQVTIYDAAAAVGGTDTEFSAAFTFNSFAYTVEVNPYLSGSTGSDYGSGTATLDDRGSSATLTIVGTTSAGEQVDATIECHAVNSF